MENLGNLLAKRPSFACGRELPLCLLPKLLFRHLPCDIFYPPWELDAPKAGSAQLTIPIKRLHCSNANGAGKSQPIAPSDDFARVRIHMSKAARAGANG